MWILNDPDADPFVDGSPLKGKKMKLAVLDFETTGLDTDYDEAIELCVQIWTPETGLDTSPEGTFYRLWQPQGPAHEGAAKVNGFSREAWEARGARPLCQQDMYDLNIWLAGHAPNMWCGHNAAKFDLPLLHSTYRRVRAKCHSWRGDHRIADTQSLAVPLLFTGELASVSLENVAKHFGVINPAPHTAPGDVFTCVGVLEAMCGRYLGARAA